MCVDMFVTKESTLFFPKRVQHRRFDYEPRYYDPSKEENLRQRMRIQRRARSKRQNPSRLLIILGLLIMALYIFLKL